jgi:hypothetical protein
LTTVLTASKFGDAQFRRERLETAPQFAPEIARGAGD